MSWRVWIALHRLIGGVGWAVVVEGPAGIGKSELLAAVRAGGAARGFAVLWARGSEFEAGMAFGVARQLFEPLLRAASAGERRELLDGVARVGARALGVVAGEAPADRFAAIHGLFWLCANRAERGPVVVVVDDAQWVDDPSLGWLGYVARRVGELAVMLVLGLRAGDVGAVTLTSSMLWVPVGRAAMSYGGVRMMSWCRFRYMGFSSDRGSELGRGCFGSAGALACAEYVCAAACSRPRRLTRWFCVV